MDTPSEGQCSREADAEELDPDLLAAERKRVVMLEEDEAVAGEGELEEVAGCDTRLILHPAAPAFTCMKKHDSAADANEEADLAQSAANRQPHMLLSQHFG